MTFYILKLTLPLSIQRMCEISKQQSCKSQRYETNCLPLNLIVIGNEKQYHVWKLLCVCPLVNLVPIYIMKIYILITNGSAFFMV